VGAERATDESGELALERERRAGTDVFRFTASEDTGEGTLVLAYRRPWGPDVPAEEEFVLEVTVR